VYARQALCKSTGMPLFFHEGERLMWFRICNCWHHPLNCLIEKFFKNYHFCHHKETTPCLMGNLLRTNFELERFYWLSPWIIEIITQIAPSSTLKIPQLGSHESNLEEERSLTTETWHNTTRESFDPLSWAHTPIGNCVPSKWTRDQKWFEIP